MPLTVASLSWTIIGPDGVTRTATATSSTRGCSKAITASVVQTAALSIASAQGAAAPQIIVDWHNDDDDVGVTYNLLRSSSPNGPWTQVNQDRLVSAGGECPAIDQPGNGTFYYTIENVDPDGEIFWFDAAPVTVSGGAIRHTLYLPVVWR